MFVLLCTLSPFLIMGVGSDAYWGVIPENVRTYTITYSNSDNHDYAALFVDGQWVTEGTPNFSDNKQVTLYYDYPWLERAPNTTLFRNIQVNSEPRALRSNRIEQGYLDAGYELLRINEEIYPVHRRDLELAKRASEIMRRDQSVNSVAGDSSYNLNDNDNAGENGYNPLVRWGSHGLTITLATLLLVFIYKKF